jgi:hypothetical protein
MNRLLTHSFNSIWNFANAHTLVIVTANVSPGTSNPVGGQMDRIDVEIIDGSHKGNVYLAKKVGTRSVWTSRKGVVEC